MRLFYYALGGLLLATLSTRAQSRLAAAQAAEIATVGPDPLEVVKNLFAPSEVFVDKANFIWVDYHLISNRGRRADLIKTVLPSLGINYERQLWKGLGVRFSGSTHWWQENRTLAETTTTKFNQLFDFRYWSIGLGPTYHLNVSRKIDPFVGLAVTYRQGEATCPCYTLKETSVTGDLYAGARYFVSNGFFVMGEAGQNGTGYLKIGSGFKF